MLSDSPPRSIISEMAGAPRRWLRALFRWLGLERWLGPPPHPFDRAAFTSAFVALAAKMAKADGVAVAVEKEAFEAFLEVEGAELANVRRLFDLAKEDTSGFESYAEHIADELHGDHELKGRVLECLIYIACSDGILHPAEDAFLHTVAARFGLSEDEWTQMRAQFVHDPSGPFAVLGLPPAASRAEVKARYRALVSETHPDRLAATGAPPAIVKAANAKLAAINAAYDAIMRKEQKVTRAP